MKVEIVKSAVVECFLEVIEETKFIDNKHKKYIRENIGIISKSENSRSDKAITAGEIQKLLAYDALKMLSKNTRGFSELCSYIDKYIEYEDFLFAVDDKYRDHTIHAVWVMMLGTYLRSKYDFLNRSKMEECLLDIGNYEATYRQLINEMEQYELSVWILTSLTHDLGYPIEKTKIANQKMAEMISYFGFLKKEPFDYNSTVVHQGGIENLINLISSRIVNDGTYKVIQLAGRDTDYGKSFEKLDHGIMSSYLLQYYIDAICEKVAYAKGEKYGFTNLRQVAVIASFMRWLKAIAWHTNVYGYTRNVNELGSILVICDELEEFSRYSKSKNEWKEVNIRTEIGCSRELLEIAYTIDGIADNIELPEFFENKARSFNNHYDVDEDEGELKKIVVICRDISKSKPIEYIFTKDIENKITAKYKVGNVTTTMEKFESELLGLANCQALFEE